jgi:hypothetical protein
LLGKKIQNKRKLRLLNIYENKSQFWSHTMKWLKVTKIKFFSYEFFES